ncbi:MULTISPECIES: GTP 3',8-cyclase MoaA [unclassified Enterococcus]|uniref:GTP 3',8-cyclase MoaA n=1 Tax=unclassified Enterococcus TaxID=2608891 RepID=UPI001CE1D3C6|nr:MULTISPECIES: GTP 3',8-cyclase MoaA [unclassified Enterococcus]MCA5011738.1 GTP 3',8-cyclase MoaA [Enterococcus sp. S23]MCA5014820.1 GTP 3',8-cyclase MoaA [Enterococcus sp. S22(2020)]
MRDSFNREIDYVRLSVTDRCDLRCTYCMPEKGMCFLKKEEVLSQEEILFLLTALAEQGIKKVKITGGEPLVRRDTVALIAKIKEIKGIEKVTMTTNGIQLVRHAQALKDAGLDGLNISIDTLDLIEFRTITRVGELTRVLDGLKAALKVGLPNIKINTVARGELTDQEIVEIAGLAQNEALHVRFIELMPIGLGKGCPGRTQEELFSVIQSAYGRLDPFEQRLGNGPASYFSLPAFQGKIGFISALGHCFCAACDRIRITADGNLKTCLHMDEGCSLKPALTAQNKELLLTQIFSAIQQKPEKHHFLETQGDSRFMSQIGG